MEQMFMLIGGAAVLFIVSRFYGFKILQLKEEIAGLRQSHEDVHEALASALKALAAERAKNSNRALNVVEVSRAKAH